MTSKLQGYSTIGTNNKEAQKYFMMVCWLR